MQQAIDSKSEQKGQEGISFIWGILHLKILCKYLLYKNVEYNLLIEKTWFNMSIDWL